MRCRSTSRASALLALAALAAASRPAHAEEPPFSSSGAKLSDTTLAISVVTPVALQLGDGWNDDAAHGLLVYGETLVLNTVLNQTVKHLTGRDRPYRRSRLDAVRAYDAAHPRDGHLSFYSGHASTAFAAAVAGSLLYRGEDEGARAAVWGFEIALAAATSDLRVRAGKHWASDVLVGAAAGVAVGVLVPTLQGDGRMPGPAEWGAMAGGLVAGVLGAQFFPIQRDILAPLPIEHGAGVSLTRVF